MYPFSMFQHICFVHLTIISKAPCVKGISEHFLPLYPSQLQVFAALTNMDLILTEAIILVMFPPEHEVTAFERRKLLKINT